MTRVHTLRGRDLGEYGSISCGKVRRVVYSDSVVSFNPISNVPAEDEVVAVKVSHAMNETVIRNYDNDGLLTVKFNRLGDGDPFIVNDYYMQDRESRYFNCCRPFDEEGMVESAHPHRWSVHLSDTFIGYMVRVSERKKWNVKRVLALILSRRRNAGREALYTPLAVEWDQQDRRWELSAYNALAELKQHISRLSFADALFGPWR